MKTWTLPSSGAVTAFFAVWTLLMVTALLSYAHQSAADPDPGTRKSLLPWKFTPLPLGSVRPLGWLRGELNAMASGLAGHELRFLPYVNNSRWLGGTQDYSALNEALPYWFNGLVPLAYAVDADHPSELRAQVRDVATEVLARQQEDGWIGPEVKLEDRNLWGRVPFLLGLTQLAEAEPGLWRVTVVRALVKYLRLVDSMLKDGGKGFTQCGWHPNDCSWGQVRVHDFIVVIQWLLERGEVAGRDGEMLWGIMEMVYAMSAYKWEDWYTEERYQQVVADATPGNPDFAFLHGVNVGQGLKASAVIRRFDKRESLAHSARKGVDWTFKYHGSAAGTILADEVQRDLAPYMGSELCTAVETGYSLAYLYQALGDNSFADRAELVIFNALPTMFTHDLWGHQYMSRGNGPWALAQTHQHSQFTTANGVATIFGLEPQYPCCTVNHPQGYPKFLSHSWALAETGLVHALLSPSVVNVTLPHAGRVTIECKTDYPFSDYLVYNILAETSFDLFLRLPSWAGQSQSTSSIAMANVAGGGGTSKPVSIDAHTGLHRLAIPAGRSTVTFTLATSIRVEPRPNDAVSVYVGSLLYSLDIGHEVTSSLPHRYFGGDETNEFQQFEKVRDYYFNHTKPWNVAIDTSTLRFNPGGNENEPLVRAFGDSNEGPNQAPGSFLSVDGCQIDWTVLGGVAPNPPPKNPTCVGEKQTYRMIPFGLAKVHMAELPTVKLPTGSLTGPQKGGKEVPEWGDL